MSVFAPPQIGANSATSFVVTDETTTSTSYTDLATVQSVTIIVPQSGVALVTFSMGIYNVAAAMRASFAVSGNTTVAANDNWSLRCDVASFINIQGMSKVVTGLTPGSNTFTLKFKTTSGTAHFFERTINAVALP